MPKNASRNLLMAVIGSVVGIIVAGCGTVRGGYESAPYSVVRVSGKFEVRNYPALTVAETSMARNTNGSDGSFNRLFRFISGGNEASQKIPMTTPVFMSGSETNATMAFMMPAEMKTGDVPKPADGKVKVRELPSGSFAVLRYSGGRSATNEAEALEKLRAWMKSEGFKELSEPIYAYFDPPWTPAFLRRNEVMVRTHQDGSL